MIADKALHQVPPQPGGVSWFDQHDPGWEARVDEEADMLEQSAFDDHFALDEVWFQFDALHHLVELVPSWLVVCAENTIILLLSLTQFTYEI